MTRPYLAFLVILSIGAFSGCSKEAPPAASKAPESSQATPKPTPPAPTSPSPAPAATPTPVAAPSSAALKTEDTNIPNVVADVTECRRKDGVLSIKVRFRNTGSAKANLGLIENRDYEKYYVSAANKKYFILKDSEGTYLTPQASGTGSLTVTLDPGGQYAWWAKYPAPPDDVKAITLYLKVAAPLEDVPVSDL